jgi:hypothetical protein
MDALLQTLRFFAQRPNDPNGIVLCELRVRDYLKRPDASLQKLGSAIDEELKACQGDNRFWMKMQKLVQSLSE